MDMAKQSIMPDPAVPAPTEAQLKRASDIAAVKAQIVPLKELETVSVRPCCNDVIFAYKAIEGVGRPDNLAVNGAALWEQEALDAWQALQDAVEAAREYFEGYAFPDKPAEEAATAEQVAPEVKIQ
jgi:hypothetical protein